MRVFSVGLHPPLLFYFFINKITVKQQLNGDKRKHTYPISVVVCSEGLGVLKSRLSNHRLPIQQRRSLGIPRDERICTVCDSGELGDQFHYLLNCSNENVKRNRTKFVDKYYTHHPNVRKFCSLMNMTSKSKNIKLAKFISCILELFWLSQ